ncbi:hypothetical protein TNCV_4445331 [Trichonephila clavipes]|nr:hypothetical protein TNCV_4445331 [Trichonephila clavipes]
MIMDRLLMEKKIESFPMLLIVCEETRQKENNNNKNTFLEQRENRSCGVVGTSESFGRNSFFTKTEGGRSQKVLVNFNTGSRSVYSDDSES